MPKTAKALADEIEEIWNAAAADGRDLTPNERIHMKGLVDAPGVQHQIEIQIKQLGGGMTSFVATDPNANWTGGVPRRRVRPVEGVQAGAVRPRPELDDRPVEVSKTPLQMKGTLLESGSTAGQVRYVVGGTATNAAAGVAEGGTKPESTIAMSEVVEPIKKIATVLPISDELLEDAPSIQSYLNGRLGPFVRVEEERQLLRGTGTNELVGIFGRSGINQYTKLAADDNATALAKVLANTAGSAFLVPDTIIIHPTNWLNTRLLGDGTGGTVGQFFGGGPFGGAYGNGGAVDAGLFGASLWNTRVVLSNYVGAGTALVGNFGQAAHIWRRGGVSVEASNSHDTFFIKNLNMLRAEERLGLGCVPPGRVYGGPWLDVADKSSVSVVSPNGRTDAGVQPGGGRSAPSEGRPHPLLETRRSEMEFTETQADILANAYLLAREGRGQVLEPWAYPDAVELEEAGWLERRYVDATGDWSWHWTRQAEGALDLNALTASATAPGSQNRLDGTWTTRP